jgi:hypothetical protein
MPERFLKTLGFYEHNFQAMAWQFVNFPWIKAWGPRDCAEYMAHGCPGREFACSECIYPQQDMERFIAAMAGLGWARVEEAASAAKVQNGEQCIVEKDGTRIKFWSADAKAAIERG